MKYLSQLIPEGYYHIFSHANGFENIFQEPDNYRYFLSQYEKYIPKVVDTYAWCLMPNHFHFLVKVKNLHNLNIPHDYPYDSHKFVMQHFSNFLNSYTKAFNKKYGRMGSLFVNQVRRSYIDSEDYLYKTLHYIHENPVKHRFLKKSDEWFYSSLHNYRHPMDNGFLAADAKNLYKKAADFSQLNYDPALEEQDCRCYF